jgi:hypothetical protein
MRFPLWGTSRLLYTWVDLRREPECHPSSRLSALASARGDSQTYQSPFDTPPIAKGGLDPMARMTGRW